MLDAQVRKSFDLAGGRSRLSLAFSVFNVLNVNAAQELVNYLNSTSPGLINSIQPPRVARHQAARPSTIAAHPVR